MHVNKLAMLSIVNVAPQLSNNAKTFGLTVVVTLKLRDIRTSSGNLCKLNHIPPPYY